MPDVTFTQTLEQLTKLQLAIYILQPGQFDIGETVIQRRTIGSPLIVSDGTGHNILAVTDTQLQAVIDNGRPPDDSIAKILTRRYWRGLLCSAREKRDAYLSALDDDPLKDDMG